MSATIHLQTGSSQVRCGAPMRAPTHPEGWDLGTVSVDFSRVTTHGITRAERERAERIDRHEAWMRDGAERRARGETAEGHELALTRLLAGQDSALQGEETA